MTGGFSFDFDAARLASEAEEWQRIVAHIYEWHYGPRGFVTHQVEPVTREEQRNSIDYRVTLISAYDGETVERLCELKTEKNPSKRISVERWNSLEKGVEGWPFKPIEIHNQELLTVWRDGKTWLQSLEPYKNWLCREIVPRYDAERFATSVELKPRKAYPLPSGLYQVRLPNPTWTTETILVPVAEPERAFGTSGFYTLTGEWLELAQESIDVTTRANEGGAK